MSLSTTAKHPSIASTVTSPEKEEKVYDVQQGFVFGNSVVESQPPYVPSCEDVEPQGPTECYSTETLCLSRSNLKQVPDSILKNTTLKHLSLEGNQISSIPDSMFISLPNLQWLDLRKNQIVSLPAEIGSHRSLKTLLLEGNPLSELPPELGNVITLKGLNLRDCPIRFPPQDIVHQGLQSILHYLRSTMAKRPVSTKTPGELPIVEKLQLSELPGSSMEEQDEAVEEDELQKFMELKHKLTLLDKAELGPKSQPLPTTKKKRTTTKAGIIPELALSDTQHWKRPEERRQAAINELKENQAILEHRRKNQEALQKWHTQAKIAQEKKISEYKQKERERQRKQEEADANSKPGLDNRSGTDVTQYKEDRSAQELERQIRAQVEKIQERRRNPRGTSTEQMAAAEEDVEEMRKLQMQLLERKRNQGKDHKKSFIIYTGGTWPSFLDK
ncbi:leucine-rich repeat-containing protein 27 [Amphiprion ocellaris]|uniref:Leucine-rich repeat protein SHOC-2 n=1 Tax=Amphiprion ocellaris TaxID=80972 RepID=A0A3Q1CUR8_AMPOC|nr:leucine-rich repeat-containing protein 27 [Amphiprion ocellaris]XP_023134145.2 leucine-rich repeat-containing protein 27 [Amphiprion ocellaris]